MSELTRTHTIEGIIEAPLGTAATLMGWVDSRRDLGQLIFIILRDRWGTLQCTIDPEHNAKAHAAAEALRGEWVVALNGVTRPRPDKEVRDYPGGDREFIVDACNVIARAETPPFVIEEDVKASEEMRLKYRYLDLRRRTMVNSLTTRHKTVRAIREHLNGLGFLEVETPLLARSTPEGARDYVVPSRVHPGQFYALPQSPQLFKQILMCAGIDKYYQIAKCLRDEDLRGNRQPEHTQLDLEMSFASRDELFTTIEGCMQAVWSDTLGEELDTPFPRLGYDEVMQRWGSDKPDLRFGSEICDVTELWQGTEAKFITGGLEAGSRVHGVFIPGASLSRKELDGWTETAKQLGAGGLMTVELGGDAPRGSVAKFVPDVGKFEELTAEELHCPSSYKYLLRKEIKDVIEHSHLREFKQESLALYDGLLKKGTDFMASSMWLPFKPSMIDALEDLTKSSSSNYNERRAAINTANETGDNIRYLASKEASGIRSTLGRLSARQLLEAALAYLVDGRMALRRYLGLGTWFMVMGREKDNLKILGQLRLKLGQEFKLIDKSQWNWLWVVDFPLYEEDEETGSVAPAHHAFTSPHLEHIPKLLSDDPAELLTIRADNYDLVLNGIEMCSGSLRIFDPALQRNVLRKVGLSDAQIDERFGWFLEAYKYGAPPHRGVGFGIDRLLMSILGVENIREVIAFPKTATASCPLTSAPASIDDAQWDELGIKPAGK